MRVCLHIFDSAFEHHQKMLVLLTLFLVLMWSENGFSQKQKDLKYNGLEVAENQGTIGEISSAYLKPRSLSLHPMTNDFMGKTDKLMTGSSNLGLHLLWPGAKDSVKSLAFNFYWRAITPSFRSKDGEPEFEKPVGIYADWIELQSAFADTRKVPLGGIKYQLALHYGNISDRGIKNAHRWIHEKINQPYSDITYEEQPIGVTRGGDAMLAFITTPVGFWGLKLNFQGAAGIDYSKIMYEYYYMFNTVFALGRNLKFGFERKMIYQISSEVYENIESKRFESTYSMILFNIYQPSVKFVSSYLKDDPVGQMYVDFVNITIPF